MVGGGLLGLQVARALSVRGVATEVVEGAEHLLSRQVDARGGAVLRRGLRQLGTEVYTGARAVRLTDEGLRLDNGFTLDTDLVVLAAGGRPSTALARQAGLSCRRGVVVGRHLESVTDERIHAIGDCAEHAGRTTGFVPPAWEQAGVLADHLAGGDATYDGSRSVARLRATGLDVAVLGDPERTDGEVVEVTNPVAGTHRKLVVRGGVIEAAALVGDLSRVGLITQLYDRRTVLGPHEPGELLMAERPPGDGSTLLPDDAEVCACAGVSAGRLRACADLDEARSTTRATTGCGGCTGVVRELLPRARPRSRPRVFTRETQRKRPHDTPTLRSVHRKELPMTHTRRTLVVAGHGMVGHRFVQAAVERGLTERYDVVVVGEEPRPAYDRVALTSFFAAESADELSLLPEGRYDDPRVRLVLDTPVASIDREDRDGHARHRRGDRLRRAGAGHRRGAVRAAGPGTGPGRLLRLPDHRGPRGDPRGRRTGERRRGHRRRAARPRGGQRPGPARPGDPRGRDGAAADAGPARPGRRQHAGPPHRAARRHRAHRGGDLRGARRRRAP